MSPCPFSNSMSFQAHIHPLHFLYAFQVLSVGKLYNPDVRYSFNIPIEDKPQQFYWNSHGPWQACSKPCQGICF